ncbi:MAG TPA: homogentisate 1,2-dioxygenase, partial [Oceanicaulis sp.]|nr:homogentisate 1,2-dioxygenase [Oceanicaulis sp.]
MARKWIYASRVEGNASRQAHADMPEGTYEREMSKEGFFGPAAFLHHKRPPTGWVDFEGPLQPRAFDLNKLGSPQNTPWDSASVLYNNATDIRFWSLSEPMTTLARNADGDQLLFIHRGAGSLFCDFGHLEYEAGDYIVLPRGTLWRLSPSEPTLVLMVEATNTHYTLPDKGLVGPHAVFDPAMFDVPA